MKAGFLIRLKNIFYAARTTAQGAWNQMEVRPVELSGKTWGIVGMGRIGEAVAAHQSRHLRSGSLSVSPPAMRDHDPETR